MLFWTIFNGTLFVINISSAINAIINNNINVELNDADYVGIIEKIKNWIDEDRIVLLKEKLKNSKMSKNIDINHIMALGVSKKR